MENNTIVSNKKASKLNGELVVVAAYFIFSGIILIACFGYEKEAIAVPVLCGSIGFVLSGMRLIYLLFPQLKLGEFKHGGLAAEFDSLKEGIQKDLHLRIPPEETSKSKSSQEEIKAFIYLTVCFISFLLFGYLVGTFLVILACCLFYNYKQWRVILISLISLYLIIYVLLYKLLEAPAFYGLLLEPLMQ